MDKPLDSPPPQLKQLLPFIQRANELRTADKVITYWALFYAAQLGIAANAMSDQQSKLYLLDLMDTLEALKANLADNEAVTNETAATAYVDNFALKVFVGADNEDRSGKATRATAKRFLAAANFIELLKVWGDLEPDMQAKAKYAKWKAADIAKAFKEGRTPQPGPAGGDPKQDAAEFDNAVAGGLQPKEDKEEEDAYLAREMAKLTAPEPAGPSALPQAISPASPGELNPFDEEAQKRKRATSRARMSLHMDGSPLPSPNFSKPLQPQLPSRSGSVSGQDAAGATSPPRPLSSNASVHSGAGLDAGSAPWSGSPQDGGLAPSSSSQPSRMPALPIPPAQHGTGPGAVTPGSRPLPVPPPRDGLPRPPSTPSQLRDAPSGGRASPANGSAAGWPSHASGGLPSVPVSPNFRDAGDAAFFGAGGPAQGAPSAPGLDAFHSSFPATPSAPPLPSAPDGPPSSGPSSSVDPSNAPIVHYQLAPTAPQPIIEAAAAAAAQPVSSAAAAPPAPAPADVPDSLPLKLSVRVQKLAKSAASAVDFEDLDTARFQLRQALDILEGRVTE